MDFNVIIFLASFAIATVRSQVRTVKVPPGALVEFEFEFINQKPGQRGGQAAGRGGASGMPQMMTPMMGGGAGQSMGAAGQMMGGAGQMMGGAGPMMGGAGMMMGGAGPMMGGAGPMMGGAGQMMGGAGPMMGGAGPMMGGTGPMMGGAGQMMGPPPMMPQMPAGPPGSPLQQLLSNMVEMALSLRQMHRVNKPLPPMEEPCPCDADCCLRPTDPRRVLPVLSIPMTLHRGCCGCVECPASLSPVISGMIQAAKVAASRQTPVDL